MCRSFALFSQGMMLINWATLEYNKWYTCLKYFVSKQHLTEHIWRCQDIFWGRMIYNIVISLRLIFIFKVSNIRYDNFIRSFSFLLSFYTLSWFVVHFKLCTNVTCYLVFINKTFIIQCLLSSSFQLGYVDTVYKEV